MVKARLGESVIPPGWPRGPCCGRTCRRWRERVECVRAMFVLTDRTAEATQLARTYVWWQEPALTLAHPRKLLCRQSLDFDFFSADPLDRTALRRSTLLAGARTLQDEPDTLTVAVEKAGSLLKLSFFGGIGFGRVGDPLRVERRVPIASRLDLLGVELATVTQRIEDYPRTRTSPAGR